MDHVYYASPFAAIAWPLAFGPLLAVWIVGRKNLIGKAIYRNLPGTFLFWLGATVLAALTAASAGRVALAFIAPTPGLAVSAQGVTCDFGKGLVTLPWNYVTDLKSRTDAIARKGATVHEHFAVFALDPRYLDHLPWDNATRRSHIASCYLDDLDAPADSIYRAIETAWRAPR